MVLSLPLASSIHNKYRNGDSNRRGDRISQLHSQEGQDFSVTPVVGQLITHKTLVTRVLSLEVWILQEMVWTIIT